MLYSIVTPSPLQKDLFHVYSSPWRFRCINCAEMLLPRLMLCLKEIHTVINMFNIRTGDMKEYMGVPDRWQKGVMIVHKSGQQILSMLLWFVGGLHQNLNSSVRIRI